MRIVLLHVLCPFLVNKMLQLSAAALFRPILQSAVSDNSVQYQTKPKQTHKDRAEEKRIHFHERHANPHPRKQSHAHHNSDNLQPQCCSAMGKGNEGQNQQKAC